MDCENFAQGNNQNSYQNPQTNSNPQQQPLNFFPPNQNFQQPAYAQQTNQFSQATPQQPHLYPQQPTNNISPIFSSQNPATIQNLSRDFQQMNFAPNPHPNPNFPNYQIPPPNQNFQNFAPLPQPNFSSPQIQSPPGHLQGQNFNAFFPDQNSIHQSLAQGQTYEPVKPAKNMVKRTYNMRNSTKAKKQASLP